MEGSRQTTCNLHTVSTPSTHGGKQTNNLQPSHSKYTQYTWREADKATCNLHTVSTPSTHGGKQTKQLATFTVSAPSTHGGKQTNNLQPSHSKYTQYTWREADKATCNLHTVSTPSTHGGKQTKQLATFTQ